MKRVALLWQTWKEDSLLRTVVRNTGYLFSSNTLSLGLSLYQGLLAALLLGPEQYGLLGMVIVFVSNVNRLLSFRMGELVVKYAGEAVALERKDEAGSIIKLAALAEGVSSVFAFILLVALAPLAVRYIIKEPAVLPWIPLYGLALLGNLCTETSTAVLQIAQRFRAQAILSLLQNLVTAGGITLAYLMRWGVFEVMLAYLAGKLIYGVAMMALAARVSGGLLGNDWWQASLRRVSRLRELGRFALSTNLSGTVNMIIRDNELLWAGYFLTSLQAGYYKFALALINVILLPITPFIQTTYPEIARSVARRSWGTLRALLRRTSLIALAWTAATGLGLIIVGPPFLRWFKGGAYLPSFPLILLLFVGYGFANILFWNRPLMLALGKPNEPLVITTVVGLLKLGLMFVLVGHFGVMALAGLLSGYFVVSIALIVIRGIQELRRAEMHFEGGS